MQYPSTPQLNQRRWAVISAYYVNFDLTHAEAVEEATDIQRRGQLGATVVTNKAAHKALESNPSLRTRETALAA